MIAAVLLFGIAAGTVKNRQETKYKEEKEESQKEAFEPQAEGSSAESMKETPAEPENQESEIRSAEKEPESELVPEAAQTEESTAKTASEQPGTAAQETGFRRVGYFTSWSAYARGLSFQNVDGDLLTHLNFAFANLRPDGTIEVGDPKADTRMSLAGRDGGHFGQLAELKAKYPNLKVLLSVGGWSWSDSFSKVAASGEKRGQFARSAVEMMTRYGFDGLDVDWEYPVAGGDNIPHRADDGKNYVQLLKAVRSAFDELEQVNGRRYLLSIAGGAGASFVKNNRIKEMMDCLDYINIMAYDYHGPWEKQTGHNAPLYAGDGFCVSETVKGYLAAGAAPEKLNLGLAFYGRGWALASLPQPAYESEDTLEAEDRGGLGQPGFPLQGSGIDIGTWEPGVFDVWDLEANYAGKNGFVRYFDEAARAPYLCNGTSFITYDDRGSILEKLDYASGMKLGGVMFWEFGGDKDKELQRLIFEYGR